MLGVGPTAGGLNFDLVIPNEPGPFRQMLCCGLRGPDARSRATCIILRVDFIIGRPEPAAASTRFTCLGTGWLMTARLRRPALLQPPEPGPL